MAIGNRRYPTLGTVNIKGEFNWGPIKGVPFMTGLLMVITLVSVYVIAVSIMGLLIALLWTGVVGVILIAFFVPMRIPRAYGKPLRLRIQAAAKRKQYTTFNLNSFLILMLVMIELLAFSAGYTMTSSAKITPFVTKYQYVLKGNGYILIISPSSGWFPLPSAQYDVLKEEEPYMWIPISATEAMNATNMIIKKEDTPEGPKYYAKIPLQIQDKNHRPWDFSARGTVYINVSYTIINTAHTKQYLTLVFVPYVYYREEKKKVVLGYYAPTATLYLVDDIQTAVKSLLQTAQRNMYMKDVIINKGEVIGGNINISAGHLINILKYFSEKGNKTISTFGIGVAAIVITEKDKNVLHTILPLHVVKNYEKEIEKVVQIPHVSTATKITVDLQDLFVGKQHSIKVNIHTASRTITCSSSLAALIKEYIRLNILNTFDYTGRLVEPEVFVTPQGIVIKAGEQLYPVIDTDINTTIVPFTQYIQNEKDTLLLREVARVTSLQGIVFNKQDTGEIYDVQLTTPSQKGLTVVQILASFAILFGIFALIAFKKR